MVVLPTANLEGVKPDPMGASREGLTPWIKYLFNLYNTEIRVLAKCA